MSLRKNASLIAKCLLLISVNFVLPATFSSAAYSRKENTALSKIKSPTFLNKITRAHLSMGLYNMLSLDSLGLSAEAFKEAITGYENLRKAGAVLNNAVLSIVDFSLPSFKKRFFVLDMENGKLLVQHTGGTRKKFRTDICNKIFQS